MDFIAAPQLSVQLTSASSGTSKSLAQTKGAQAIGRAQADFGSLYVASCSKWLRISRKRPAALRLKNLAKAKWTNPAR
jgi:hypothetical protein